MLDPESPMAELPELGVDWPTISADEPGTADAGGNAAQVEGERRYTVALDGLKEIDSAQIAARFDKLSALKEGEGKPANVAQLDRRAKQDAELLDQLLRAEGYYDATIAPRIDAAGDSLVVVMTIEPGPLYRFEQVTVTGLDAAGDKGSQLRDVFAVDTRDPVNADDVIAGEAALRTSIASEGYPFAKIGEPEVVVDHETRMATLSLNVETGAQQRVAGFKVVGDRPPFNAKHVATIARIDSGDLFDATRIEDLRRAIIATGLVSSVAIEPVPGAVPGTVDLSVRLEQAPLRTIAGEAGYGTGEGFRLSGSWTHRNLIRPEGAVTFAGIVGTQEQSLAASLRQSNFRARDQVLNARIAASNIDRAAYDARTFSIGASLERQTNIIWQKKWTWSAGFELLASDERDVTAAGARRRTFFIGALPAVLAYDGSDDLLDPTRGFRVSARFSPELSLDAGTYGYLRAQLDGSGYIPFKDRVVLAGRVRLGSIMGAGLGSIAPSRRFYSGGGGSVRGYGYQRIGPRDAFNDPVGGRSLAEFALEARVRFGDFAVVPFLDGGNIYEGKLPRLKGFRFGAGIGGRYHSSFGPIRIDLGTPINRQPGDSRITVFVSLGQAF